MSRFLSAYDTTACNSYNNAALTKIHDALKVCYVRGEIIVDDKTGCILITGNYGSQSMASFYHPIHLEIDGKDLTFVDVRTIVKTDPHSITYTVKDQDEFNFVTTRGQLDGLWHKELPGIFKNFSSLPMAAYATLISNYIEKTLALDPRDSLPVTVLAAVHYINLFSDDDSVSKTDAMHLSAMIAQNLKFQQSTVYSIVENNTVLRNLDEFCEACKNVSQSVRLKDLNPVTLYGMVGSAWYGNNGRELISVALEHPPTWITLINRALTSRGYFNSGLAKLLERGMFKRLAENYSKQFNQLLETKL